MSSAVWGNSADAGYTAGTSLAGFKVEAADGSVDKVEKHFHDGYGLEGWHGGKPGPWPMAQTTWVTGGTGTGYPVHWGPCECRSSDRLLGFRDRGVDVQDGVGAGDLQEAPYGVGRSGDTEVGALMEAEQHVQER